VLKANQRLSPAQALSLIGQAARALDAAHRKGLVHRDVKPANLLIERGADDDPDYVYLADFGITKHELSRSGLTATGQFVGTLAYIAPEQIQGKHVGPRSDIYSLGCVLYESLTGRVPFPKPIDAAVIWAHVEEQPTPPSAVCADLPNGIDEVIIQALAKDPDDRYATCRELVEAARAAVDSAPRTSVVTKVSDRPDTVLRNVEPPSPPLAIGPPMDPPVRRDIEERSISRPVVEEPVAGSTPQARRRRRPLLAGGVATLLVLAGVAAWLVSRGDGTKVSSRHAAAAVHHPNPILTALAITNKSATAKGLLPPSSCKTMSAAMIMCTHPAFGANTVTISTFPTLTALYTAYVAEARSLGLSPLRTNFDDCTEQQTFGEVSWNHRYQHPRQYSLAQSRSGRLGDDQAAGRVFCTFSNSQLTIVWTQNDGRVLGVLTGFPHANTWDWWKGVHHSIDIPGAQSNMQMTGSHM
jgi:serine/threonine protein kinase